MRGLHGEPQPVPVAQGRWPPRLLPHRFERLGQHRPGDAGELVHVAQNLQAADEWLSRHGYPEAELQEVTADDAATDGDEGRAA